MSEENTTVFTATATTEPSVVPPTTPTIPPEVSEFVGTGKKYASVEVALASIPHAQKHITTIEQELAQAKEELAKRRTAAELLEEMKAQGNQTSTTSTVQGLSPEQVTQLIEQSIAQKDAKAVASDNVNKVTSAFTEKFGDKAEETFIAIAKEAGVSIQYMNQLAAVAPTAVLKLAGIDNKVNTNIPTKPTSSFNTDTLKQGSPNTDLSARVKAGASTKDLVSAWKTAGLKVGKPT